MTAATIDVHGFSEQGPRPENQDAFDVEAFSSHGLLMVADGMGGLRGGRAAAETAIAAVREAAPLANHVEARRALAEADRAIRERAEREPDELSGMGCAMGILSRVRKRGEPEGWIVAHVGDVRVVSRSPDGVVRLETRDHTPAFTLWEEGRIGVDEIPEAEGANRLYRAAGHGGEGEASWIPLAPGWRYAILSDGVTKAMRLDELGRALAEPNARAACEAIREKVRARGPDDNFTAVVAAVPGGGATAPPPPSPDPDETMIPPPSRSEAPSAAPRQRSVVGPWLVALLALLVAGLAGWMAWEARDAAAEAGQLRAEVAELRGTVDSLRLELREAVDPFGPETSPPPTPEEP